MRIFVYEFVTGGGLADQSLPPGLVHEADLMLRSLLQDLGEIPGVECLTSRDPRLAPISGVETLDAVPGEDSFALYERGLSSVDAAWPTAPETASALERLGRLTLRHDRTLLGTHPDSVRLTGSKRSTAAYLTSANIPAVPTYGAQDDPFNIPGRWVVKPDDGVGADDTLVLSDLRAARAILAEKGASHVAQPWIEGKAMSLSLLCAFGEARVLTCNRQRVAVANGRVVLQGISVNAESARAPVLAGLASEIAAAIPMLWGHVGVDLILTETGPVVLEINPRLTTSYCGLRQAISHNPAAWVIDLVNTGRLPHTPPPESGTVVELTLEGANVG